MRVIKAFIYSIYVKIGALLLCVRKHTNSCSLFSWLRVSCMLFEQHIFLAPVHCHMNFRNGASRNHDLTFLPRITNDDDKYCAQLGRSMQSFLLYLWGWGSGRGNSFKSHFTSAGRLCTSAYGGSHMQAWRTVSRKLTTKRIILTEYAALAFDDYV